MPYVSKKKTTTKSKPKGIGATAKGKKTSKGYGGKSIDWEAAMKLADAAAAKQINKTIETQYSQAMTTLTYSSAGGATAPPTSGYSGFNLVGLNQNWSANNVAAVVATSNTAATPAYTSYTPLNVYNQMMVFNLSALSQVKGAQSGSISGWRQGYKINALALTINLTGEIDFLSSDCEYHMMLVRRKDGSNAGNYQTPQLVTSDTMSLYKPITDGPFGTTSYGNSPNVPDPFYLSLMRRNTDAWSFVEKGHTSKKLYASPQGNASSMSSMVNLSLYHSIGSAWDFTSQTAGVAPVLKGGDYYLMVWREGATDTAMEQKFRVYTQLSYKDQ